MRAKCSCKVSSFDTFLVSFFALAYGARRNADRDAEMIFIFFEALSIGVFGAHLDYCIVPSAGFISCTCKRIIPDCSQPVEAAVTH
jgi:hypothetical protein